MLTWRENRSALAFSLFHKNIIIIQAFCTIASLRDLLFCQLLGHNVISIVKSVPTSFCFHSRVVNTCISQNSPIRTLGVASDVPNVWPTCQLLRPAPPQPGCSAQVVLVTAAIRSNIFKSQQISVCTVVLQRQERSVKIRHRSSDFSYLDY